MATKIIAEMPKRGEIWICQSNPSNRLKIMAFADGYAMVRYKGCYPWTIPIKELKQSFRRSLNSGEKGGQQACPGK